MSVVLSYVKRAAKDVGCHVTAKLLLEMVAKFDPELNQLQRQQLSHMFYNVLHAYLAGRPVLPLFRGIIALVITDANKASRLLDALLQILVQFASMVFSEAALSAFVTSYSSPSSSSSSSPTQFPDLRESKQMDEKELTSVQQATQTLLEKGVLGRYLDDIPSILRPCLLSSLDNDPVCCISLEPILNPQTKKIDKDAVVIFQQIQGKSTYHSFLYKKSSLDAWFSASGRTINPATRSQINLATQYFQLS